MAKPVLIESLERYKIPGVIKETCQAREYTVQVELPVDDSEAPDLVAMRVEESKRRIEQDIDRRFLQAFEKQQNVAEALRKQYEYELSRFEYELSKQIQYDYRNWYEGRRYKTFPY